MSSTFCMRLVLSLAVISILCCAQTAYAQSVFKLMSNLPQDEATPIRVQIQTTAGTLVVGQSLARLAVGGCATAAPASNFIVRYASAEHRPVSEASSPYLWNVQFRETNAFIDATVAPASTVFATTVSVCLSNDDGGTWTALNNDKGGAGIVVWSKLPTATLSTVTPATSTAFTVTMPAALYNTATGATYTNAANTRMVVVADPSNCQAAFPTTIAGGSSQTMSATGTFTFTVTAETAAAYLCMSATAGAAWSFVPVNDFKNSVADAKGYTLTVPSEPSDFSFSIISSTRNQFTFSCTAPTTPVAGLTATCDIQIVTTAGAAVSTDTSLVVIQQLTDGAGVDLCPIPTSFTTSGTAARFTFTPQRHGRGGFIRVKYSGFSIFAYSGTANNNNYYAWAATTVPSGTNNQRVILSTMRDNRKAHFNVDPSPLDVYPFQYTNLLGTFSSFTNAGAFSFQNGVQWYKSRSTADSYEPLVATLPTGTTGPASLYNTVNFPTNAERCRLSVKYFFTANTSVSLSMNSFIGKVRVSGYTGATEVVVLKEFSLYSYLRYVIVGGDNSEPGQLDGYIRTEEQLVAEVPNTGAFTSIRLTLTIDHTSNSKLYFIAPVMQCAIAPSTSTATDSAATNANDLAGLQSIWTTNANASAAGGLRDINWRTTVGTIGFNGDPCRNQWQGIICRRNRVVEIHLRSMKMIGAFPSLTNMDALEVIDVRDNALTGTWNIGSNFPVLREVYIANNLLTSIISAGSTFSLSASTCLHTFDAFNNQIAAFPTTGLTTLSGLVSLNLGANSMINTLPASLSTMASLKYFNVNQNNLTGSLPTALPTQTLRSFDVSANKFTGNIPATYTNFRNLLYFDVSSNGLSGKIPVITMGAVRSGEKTIFRASWNNFTYLPARHEFQREGMQGNFFQCPDLTTKKLDWLPDGEYFERYMSCDWSKYNAVASTEET